MIELFIFVKAKKSLNPFYETWYDSARIIYLKMNIFNTIKQTE